ncbi:MAG: ATP-binding cassette domain-containing protein, partial [Litorivicinus sp.]
GREITLGLGRLATDEMNQKAEHWLSQVGQSLDVTLPLADLSLAHQQMIEIARALSLEADIIIMDEPTDALTEKESEKLFEVVRNLKDAGRAVVFITHRLNEIFEHCDEVVVLRDGRQIVQCDTDSLNEADLIKHMVGRDLTEQFPYVPAQITEPALSTIGLTGEGLFGVDFSASGGEVVGFAGLVGAGRTELAKTLFGVTRPNGGQILIFGEPLKRLRWD